MRPGFFKNGVCKECKESGRKGGIGVDRVNTQTGEEFVGCSNYPRCKNSAPSIPTTVVRKRRASGWSDDDDEDFDGDGF